MTTMPAKHVATSDGRDQKKGQCCIMHEAESSVSAVQSMKLLRELLLMTENNGQIIFLVSFSAAVQPLHGGWRY